MRIGRTTVWLCVVLFAWLALLDERAPAAQGSKPETAYLQAARQVARQLATLQRQEAVGVSWPVSDLNPARNTGVDVGAAGIGWFHLELFKATRDSDYLVTAEQAAAYVNARQRAGQWNGPDWLAGAAGTGSFFLALHDETRNGAFLEHAVFTAEWLLQTSIATPGGGRHWKHNAAITNIYTGMYHGAAGIGLFLLDLHQRTGDARFLTAAREAAQWIAGHTVPIAAGGIGWKRLTTDTTGYHHFCGGATGIMLFLQRMLEVTGDAQYGQLLRQSADGLVSSARRSGSTAHWSYYTDNTGNAPVIFCHGASSASLALHGAYLTLNDSRYLVTSREAAAWTLQAGKAQATTASYWPHIEGWDQFETGYQTGTASIGQAMLKLHRADPDDAYLAAAQRAGNYLLNIANRPGEGRLRWINYTNPARADWPHEYLNGWYTGAAGIGIFLIELDTALRDHTGAPPVATPPVSAAPVTAAPAPPPAGARDRPTNVAPTGRAVPRGSSPGSGKGVAYQVQPPEGALPWPQHNPAFSQAQYDQMMNSIFIINNFAVYQGGDTRDSVYFHSGLDVVLPNGTPVYAIADGTVRGVLGNGPYYLSLMIEDSNQPGWGWIYTHVQPSAAMKTGAAVQKGSQIATISFQGVEHVHLTRTYLTPGGSWTDSYAHNDVDPAPFFAFTDNEAPTIETPFYYFANQSTMRVPRGNPTVLAGKVDVVAGVRDPGEYARGRIPGAPAGSSYGDRNAPKTISIAIAAAADPERVLWSQVAFDQEKIVLKWRPGFALRDQPRVETVFAFRPETNPNAQPDYNLIFAYYFLTNRGFDGAARHIEPSDGEPSWDTTLFPDGDYLVTVTATDWKGNTGRAQERVTVRNR